MSDISHPFQLPRFRAYLIARISMVLAQNALAVVLGWQVYAVARRTMDTHEAAIQLGLIGLFQFLPIMVMTPFSGWLADRLDRRLIAGCALLLEIAMAGTLSFATWTDTLTLPLLFIVASLLGLARAFASPALQAITPRLVPVNMLPKAIAMSSIAWQTGAILGPAMGGGLYAFAPALPYWVCTGLFVLSLAAIIQFGPIISPPSEEGERHILREITEGLRFVVNNRLVLGAISLDLFAVLLGGATAMLPVYARDVLHVGSEGLGLLRGAPAVGAVLIGLILSVRPIEKNVGVKLLGAVALFGLATIGFGLSRSMILSIACLTVLGAADMISVYVRQSLIQIHTPDRMRGRVGAVSSLFISGSNELGEAESGFLAGWIGPVAAVVAGGAGAIMIALIWAKGFPELRRARTFTTVDRESSL